MNIAEASIKNPLLCIIAILIFLIGGSLAYQNMSRFEDPEFTIRIAKIFTGYPESSPIWNEPEGEENTGSCFHYKVSLK